tara:strand:+ start:1686 stop:2606 length:921 start_codon:yes stop_codon:yes gene_type:complete
MSYRCVDWSLLKADERVKNGKNAVDPYIHSFSQGCNGKYINDDYFDVTDKTTCVFRGLGKSPMIWDCIKNNIDFLYIDTGYFGNQITKVWHRIAYNNLQTLNHLTKEEIEDKLATEFTGDSLNKVLQMRRPIIRWKLEEREYHEKKKILIVPPSQKVFNHFGGVAHKYTKALIKNLKKITNREIEVRAKLSRSERIDYSLQDQLRKGKYHCIITYNSIASLESITVGVPAIVLGPNAGEYLSETNIENIEKPYWAGSEKIFNHIDYLKWCQFTGDEMKKEFTHRVIKTLQGAEKPYTKKIEEAFNV